MGVIEQNKMFFKGVYMPARTKINQDSVTLLEAMNWIAYDQFEGPTSNHLEKFRVDAENNTPKMANHWQQVAPETIQNSFEQLAQDDLLVALRDGDLRAEGRLSETQTYGWNAPNGPWGLHSGKFTPVPVEFWIGGRVTWKDSRLSYQAGEYIDVRLPLFFLQAIWPLLPQQKTKPIVDIPYGEALPFAPTPYLELLNRAVENFWSSGTPPLEKKDVLVQWLIEQKVGNEQLSKNIAECMATIIRPLEARTGGNRKW